ncbi:MAG: TRAP transporter small permease [Alphaproteobacteria bacterium]|nr:TRAP transporter small permease [Alphaproteobacteria bacterium]
MFRDGSRLERFTYHLAKWTAVAGGVALLAMIAIVILSIIGRSFIWAGLKPILGDYELVGVGVGFAAFAFVPWAHFERGHAVVSILTDLFGDRVNAIILAITDLMMLMAGSFIAWRMFDGMLDKLRFHETTLLLRLPLGWAYGVCLIGAIVLVPVSAFLFARSVGYAIEGKREPHRGGDTW